jgi:transposase
VLRLARRRRDAFYHQPGAYNTDSLIAALEQLRRFLGGQKTTLLWDGLPAHRSRAMRAWLRRQRSWLVAEPLPACAPERNPVEALWANLKGVELANLASDTLEEVIAMASVASSAFATPTTCPTRSCATATCPCTSPAERGPARWAFVCRQQLASARSA